MWFLSDGKAKEGNGKGRAGRMLLGVLEEINGRGMFGSKEET